MLTNGSIFPSAFAVLLYSSDKDSHAHAAFGAALGGLLQLTDRTPFQGCLNSGVRRAG